MRICYLGNARSPIVRSWAQHFAKGHEVHLITEESHPAPSVILHLIGNEKNPRRLLTYANKVLQTRKILKKIKPDVAHAHYVYGYGLLLALNNFHPSVATAMGNDIGVSPIKSRVINWGTRTTLRKLDLIAVKDRFAFQRAMDLGCKREKLVISHSCCDLNQFSPSVRSEELRRQWNADGKTVVAYFRQLNDEYRFPVLRQAMTEVAKRDSDIIFLLARRGKTYAKVEAELTRRFGDRVVFVDPVPHEQMQTYVASSDIWLDTYYPEYDVGGHGHGTNMLEAMACGVPQIVPDRPEYTEPWCKALLYKRGNPAALASAIIELAKDETLRRSLAEESRESVKEFGDQEKIMGEMEKLWEGLVRR